MLRILATLCLAASAAWGLTGPQFPSAPDAASPPTAAIALLGGSGGSSGTLPGNSPIPVPFWSICTAGQTCATMSDDGKGWDCPSSFIIWYFQCPSKACTYSCASSATGALCIYSLFEDCTDTTLAQSPGSCGVGTRGDCHYTGVMISQNPLRVKCSLNLGCIEDDEADPIQCGPIRTCS